MNEPILILPDLEKPFVVYIDACKNGLGAVLTQNSNLGEQVIAFASRSTKETEKDYSVYDLVAAGLDYALKIWRYYLLNNKFLVYTDNLALSYIRNKKETCS